METMDIVIKISSFLGALGVILGALSKLLDIKLKPLTNQNRMQFRHEIVGFANDLQRGIPKSRDEFMSIYEMIDEYKTICEKYKIPNHLFEESVKIIDEVFEELK